MSRPSPPGIAIGDCLGHRPIHYATPGTPVLNQIKSKATSAAVAVIRGSAAIRAPDLDRVRLVPHARPECGDDVGGFPRWRGGRGEFVSVDSDGDVAQRAQRADDTADRHAGGLVEVPADRESGEHDGEVGVDRVRGRREHRPRPQVGLRHPERRLDLE